MESESQPELILEWPSLRAAPVGRGPGRFHSGLHVVGVVVLLMLPSGSFAPAPRPQRPATVLVAPPRELTQTAPNRGRVGKEVSLENLLPRPPVRVPAAVPPISRQASRPVAPPPRQTAAAVLPEPPSVDTARTPPPLTPPQLGADNMPPPPPQIQEEEKPKLAFETPGARSGTPSGAA